MQLTISAANFIFAGRQVHVLHLLNLSLNIKKRKALPYISDTWFVIKFQFDERLKNFWLQSLPDVTYWSLFYNLLNLFLFVADHWNLSSKNQNLNRFRWSMGVALSHYVNLIQDHRNYTLSFGRQRHGQYPWTTLLPIKIKQIMWLSSWSIRNIIGTVL